jgi:methyl acetate hydrolase
MSQDLKSKLDHLLSDVVTRAPGVPGVVAMVTDREGTIYEGAAGKRVGGESADMTTDSVFAIFSTTKPITGTAVLQLVEEGKLDLDAPAKNYAPDIGALQVLDGFDTARKPILRAPKRDITTRMLLLHTAGFGYDFFNESYKRLTQELGYPGVVSSWAGLANCFFWIDRKNGVAGYWATQILPFIDGVSYPGYLAFETSVYRSIAAKGELAHA